MSKAILSTLKPRPKTNFGVTHATIIYNQKENKVFCLLDAPNPDAAAKYHAEPTVKCDWMVEVKKTK
jgi:hypothetical protein